MKQTLFGKGREKILRCFYEARGKERYFSEILRATGLSQPAGLHQLRALEASNVIVSTKKIGNTFYKINAKNPQVHAIFAYLDYQQLNELPSPRKKAIVEFLERSEKKPLIVVVFGSTAKGTFTKESDIDLLLVYNTKEKADTKLQGEIEAVTGMNIQTFIIDYAYFKEQMMKQDDAVITHAIKTGFPVSGFDLFYQEVLL